MFEIEPLAIRDVKVVTPKRFGDDRGFFSTVWERAFFEEHGLMVDADFDAFSHSTDAFTLRGMHYQVGLRVQTKLIRAMRGAIYDVVIDIRKGSPTFGHWVGDHLSAANGKMLYAPAGFAHGFITLKPDTEVAYKIRGSYSPEDERGIHWADPDIGIGWPLAGRTPETNARDDDFPLLRDAPDLL